MRGGVRDAPRCEYFSRCCEQTCNMLFGTREVDDAISCEMVEIIRESLACKHIVFRERQRTRRNGCVADRMHRDNRIVLVVRTTYVAATFFRNKPDLRLTEQSAPVIA